MEKADLTVDPALKAVNVRFLEVRSLASDATANRVHKASLVLEAKINLEERVRAREQAEQEEHVLYVEQEQLRAWLASQGWVGCSVAAS